MRHIIIPTVAEATNWSFGEVLALGIDNSQIRDFDSTEKLSCFAWRVLVIKPQPMNNCLWENYSFGQNKAMGDIYVWWHRPGGGQLAQQGKAELEDKWLAGNGPGSLIPDLKEAKWKAYSIGGAAPNSQLCQVINGLRAIMARRCKLISTAELVCIVAQLDNEANIVWPQTREPSVENTAPLFAVTVPSVAAAGESRSTAPNVLSADPVVKIVSRTQIDTAELIDLRKLFQAILFPLAVDVRHFSNEATLSLPDWDATKRAYEDQMQSLSTNLKKELIDFMKAIENPKCPIEIQAYADFEYLRGALFESFTASTALNFLRDYQHLGNLVYPEVHKQSSSASV